MDIDIPESCLVMLVGAAGSGKSAFAQRRFQPAEIVSDDSAGALPAEQALDVLREAVSTRLQLGQLAVVDAPNLEPASRRAWIELARRHDVVCVAVVFDMPEDVLAARLAERTDARRGIRFVRHQRLAVEQALRKLASEGYRFVHVFAQPDQIDATGVVRTPSPTNLRSEKGPFDIVGDVHGCLDELLQLCRKLGYDLAEKTQGWQVRHPQGRRLVFVGDLVDRGPDSPGVVRFVQAVMAAGMGFCVAGNHDAKLARALGGKDVDVRHGLERSLAQFAGTSGDVRKDAARFLGGLAVHHVMDGGRLVVAHAGLGEELHGRSSPRARSFAMHGEKTGETDEFGLPVRSRWALSYRGNAMVVHGHTPVPEAEWLNNTICVDTGCVFGGKLTALRYPERELVSVPAAQAYYPSAKPLAAPTLEPTPPATPA